MCNVCDIAGDSAETHEYVILPQTTTEVAAQSYPIRNDIGTYPAQVPNETLYTLDTQGSHQDIEITSEPKITERSSKVDEPDVLQGHITQNAFLSQTGSHSDPIIVPEPDTVDMHEQETVQGKSSNMLMRHLLTKPLAGKQNVAADDIPDVARPSKLFENVHVVKDNINIKLQRSNTGAGEEDLRGIPNILRNYVLI